MTEFEVSPDPKAHHFEDTWPRRTDINVERVDTEMIRRGWPKPTIYREHEIIHILCDAFDVARSLIEAEQHNARRARGKLVETEQLRADFEKAATDMRDKWWAEVERRIEAERSERDLRSGIEELRNEWQGLGKRGLLPQDDGRTFAGLAYDLDQLLPEKRK